MAQIKIRNPKYLQNCDIKILISFKKPANENFMQR